MENCISYEDLQQMVKCLQKDNERLTEENLNLKKSLEDRTYAREILNSKETEENWRNVMEDENDPYTELIKGFEDYYSDSNEIIHT